MFKKGSTMFDTLRNVMEAMPEDTPVSYVNLVEWPTVAWDNWDGLCTLAGDSAHCMSIRKFSIRLRGVDRNEADNA